MTLPRNLDTADTPSQDNLTLDPLSQASLHESATVQNLAARVEAKAQCSPHEANDRQRAVSAPVKKDPLGPPPPPLYSGHKRTAPIAGEAQEGRLDFENTPSEKRRRIGRAARPDRLDGFLFEGPSINHHQPPSPLFFSNTINTARPELPPRFSSDGAAMKMLSKAQAEEPNVRTVQLSRGTVSASTQFGAGSFSIARSTGTEASRLDTPDLADKGDALAILAQVGTIELLEQDNRAVFMVDLGDPSNYNSPKLQILFANSALKAAAGLLDRVIGRDIPTTPQPSSPTPSAAFAAFKTWAINPLPTRDSPGQPQKPVLFANYSWTSSTLRRRVRIVSGALAEPIKTPSVLKNDPADLKAQAAKLQSIKPEEPQDYFGGATIRSPAVPDAPDTKSRRKSQESPVSPSGRSRRYMRSGSGGTSSSSTRRRGELLRSPDTFPPTGQVATPGFSNREPGSGSPIAAQPLRTPDLPPIGQKLFDWTRLAPEDIPSDHIRFARTVDWAATPLGPIENWCDEYRLLCNLIMGSPHPSAIYLGDEMVTIYNEAYIPIAATKHPGLMGMTYATAWAELWEGLLKDIILEARTNGQAIMKDDDRLFVNRNDRMEECFFSWSLIPIVGADGLITALYNPAFDKTRRKLAERRMLTLREVGETTSQARQVSNYWPLFMEGLESNPYDTPFVLVYSVSSELESDDASIASGTVAGGGQCTLEGAIGVPADHKAAPRHIDLRTGMEGYGPIFREAILSDKPLLIETRESELLQSLIEGLEWRGFGDPCTSAAICPIHPQSGGQQVMGFLVIGINPRRTYDDDYELFLQLLTRQCATSLASVVLFEEEVRKGQKAARLAALDRLQLAEELAIRTEEARESETKFTRMAEFSPTGLFIADNEGRINFSNDAWFDISRVKKSSAGTDKWIEYVHEEDQARVMSMWESLFTMRQPVTAEFRFKAPWLDEDGNVGETWVLFGAYPQTERSEVDGKMKLKSVFGNITDISQQKWAEGYQKRRMEEAVELKKAQEKFIDITSHELRNPLSAILQCADEVSTSLAEYQAQDSTIYDNDYVNDSIEAAQTIMLCAHHQKRIVDDVLTLSKMDAEMLMITPVDVQPLTVVQSALKMFEGELQTADIDMQFIIDDTFSDLGIDWVRLDPSRILQVLINLTTNAIKFTATRKKRAITVTISASKTRPSEMEKPLVEFFPTRNLRDVTKGDDWGTGDVVYVQFAVKDTGRGLTPEERKLLFLRFSQASPRTHVQYGGSGLGLFISRELAELQGGEIGVSSEAGKGSTFAFYVKARLSTSPPDPASAELPMALTRGSMDSNKQHKPRSLNRTLSRSSSTPKLGGPATAEPASIHDLRPTPSTSQSATAGQKATANAAITPTAPSDPRIGTTHVLIVEDNLINQKVMSQQLRRYGCVVTVANHGGEALERLAQSSYMRRPDPHRPSSSTTTDNNKPHRRPSSATNLDSDPDPDPDDDILELGVILMDQEMPIMDGKACTARIRELESQGKFTRHVPIVAVTANARAEQIAALRQAGTDEVVSKPFRIPDLIPIIERLTKKYLVDDEEGRG